MSSACLSDVLHTEIILGTPKSVRPNSVLPAARLCGDAIHPGFVATSDIIYGLLRVSNLPVVDICVLLVAPGFSTFKSPMSPCPSQNWLFSKCMWVSSWVPAFLSLIPGGD